jgi:HAD superfamily hydrolase (TIGR01490 family)
MLKPHPAATKRAAYFDVDGTLAQTTLVTTLNWHLRQYYILPAYLIWLLSLAIRGPWWWMIHHYNPDLYQRSLYSNYYGLSIEDLYAQTDKCYRACFRPRLYPKAIECLLELKKEGYLIVLISGNLELTLQPLAREFDVKLIAPNLQYNDEGICSGALNAMPLVGERKANVIRIHAEEYGVDLSQSKAFGNEWGDLKMLETVGHPVVVNPDSRLKRIASQRNWPHEKWRTGKLGSI